MSDIDCPECGATSRSDATACDVCGCAFTVENFHELIVALRAQLTDAKREAAREAYEDAAKYHDAQAMHCKDIADATIPPKLLGYLAKRDQALHELAAADIRKRKP